MMHDKYPELMADVKGLSEETTTGVLRLYEMVTKGTLKVPALMSTTQSPNQNLITCTAAASLWLMASSEQPMS